MGTKEMKCSPAWEWKPAPKCETWISLKLKRCMNTLQRMQSWTHLPTQVVICGLKKEDIMQACSDVHMAMIRKGFNAYHAWCAWQRLALKARSLLLNVQVRSMALDWLPRKSGLQANLIAYTTQLPKEAVTMHLRPKHLLTWSSISGSGLGTLGVHTQ